MPQIFVAIVLVASVTFTSLTASAQDPSGAAPRETIVQLEVNQNHQETRDEIAQTIIAANLALPDAPAPAIKALAADSLLAIPQQQGGSSPAARYPNSNRRRYILLGVICAAAIVGGIVIATQRD